MQCSNCRFQNMPGSDVCGRCGTSLRLATAVIDVQPPRASPLARRLRRVGRVVPVGRAWYAARDAATGRTKALAPAWHLPPRRLLAAMTVGLLVPGLSHFRLGRRAW